MWTWTERLYGQAILQAAIINIKMDFSAIKDIKIDDDEEEEEELDISKYCLYISAFYDHSSWEHAFAAE